MKKSNIKKVIGLGVLLLFSSLFLWNCESEFTEKDSINQVSEHPFIRSIVSEHYLEFHKPEVYKHLNSLGTKKEQGQRQNYVSDEYGFTYDLDHVQIIETDLFTQYSLRVVGSETDETHVENYVFMDYANGEQEQLLFTFKGTYTLEGFEINHHQTQVQVLEGTSLFTDRCVNGMQIVDLTITKSCYDVPCTGDNHHLVGEYCPCGTEYNCHPPTTQCDTATIQSWSRCGGGSSGEDDDPNNNNGQTGGGDQTGGGNSGDTSIPVIPIAEDLRLYLFEESLNVDERAWWENSDNRSLVAIIKLFLHEENYSDLAIIWAKGQIELDLIDHIWEPEEGEVAGMKYVYKDANNFSNGSLGSYFKLEDGSIVHSSPFAKKLNDSGDLTWKHRETTGLDFGSAFYYIKIPEHEWAEVLYHPDYLFDELKNLFELGGIVIARSIGRYALPIEDIKILIDGRDFDGNTVSRWQAAGFLLLSVVPGGKALGVVDDVIDATQIALKLRGGSMVVDLAATGLRVVTDNGITRFLSSAGDEIARFIDGILTFKYTGFGGDIITKANKTTTVLGRYVDDTGKGTQGLLDSGLSRYGENPGGFNLLNESTWGNLTPDQRDLLNYSWLERAFIRGDDIRLISNPATNEFFQNTGALTQFGKELNWIENFKTIYGYLYDPITMTYTKI